MTDYNKIEELYKKHCEISAEVPPSNMWSRIEASLDEKRNQKRIVLMRYVAVAASLAVLISLSTWLWISINSTDENNYLSDNKNIPNEPTVINENYSDKQEIKKYESIQSNNTENVKSEKFSQKNNILNGQIVDKYAVTTENFEKSKPVEKISATNVKIKSENSYFFDKLDIKSQKEEQPETKVQETYSLDVFFASLYPEPEKTYKVPAKIELGGAYSPIYSFRQASVENNPYFPDRQIPSEDRIVYSGGGLNLNIKFNKRWSVESGVKYAKLGHKIDDPEINKQILSDNGNVVVINQLFLGNSMGVVNMDKSFEAKLVDPNLMPPPPNGVNIKQSYQSIEQNLDYLEVPFSLRYYIIDRKISISMSAGLSANFLVGNSFYLITNNNKEKIGKTDGISNLSMSSHAGLSLNVPVFKRLSLQVEPRINYFLQEINKDYTYKYRPYSFGVYSGVKYHFGK